MDHDAIIKRAQFIDKSVEIREMFRWASPPEVIKTLSIYCSSFYGAMLWDLVGAVASKVYSAWDTALKLTWSCLRNTRTFLLQQVLTCGNTSAKTNIMARYCKFSMGLRQSISKEVRLLFNLMARDLQSTTAKNIKFVESAACCNLWTVNQSELKLKIHLGQLVTIPPRDLWRVDYLSSLLKQFSGAKYLAQAERMSYIQELINSLGQ